MICKCYNIKRNLIIFNIGQLFENLYICTICNKHSPISNDENRLYFLGLIMRVMYNDL